MGIPRKTKSTLEDNMLFEAIDKVISDWANRHSLKLFRLWAGEEARFAYVSSVSGECFQIWIEPPKDDQIAVHLICVIGREENDPPRNWTTDHINLERTLEEVFKSVLRLMTPSERFLA